MGTLRMWNRIKKYINGIIGGFVGLLFGVAYLLKRKLKKANNELSEKNEEIIQLKESKQLQKEFDVLESETNGKINEVKNNTLHKLNGETNYNEVVKTFNEK